MRRSFVDTPFIPGALAFSIVAALAPLAPLVAPLGAQAATCPAAGYSTCAVRAEAGFFRGLHVVRGAEGTDVGRVRAFGSPNLATLLAGSDSAVVHARRYTGAARRSAALGLVGGALFVAAAIVDLRDREVTDAGLVLVGTGSLFGLASAGQQLRAQRELSRATWWYNRDLATR